MYFLSYFRIINVDENGQIKLRVPLKRTIRIQNDKDFVRFRPVYSEGKPHII